MAINKQSLMDEAVFLSRYDKLTSVLTEDGLKNTIKQWKQKPAAMEMFLPL